MDRLSRATRGGVGAVVVGVALAAGTLLAGWLSGTAYDGLLAANESLPADARVLGDSFLPEAAPQPEPPEPPGFPYVSAESIAVIDAACGALVFGREPDQPVPPASLTKLMTAAVAVEQASLTEMFRADVDARQLHEDTGSTVMGLEPGMELSLLDLLYGLLLPSGNDAAIVIARGVAGSEDRFVSLMNAKAESLALDATHFTNPHGLYEDGLHSSARDMAMLARFVLQNDDLKTIVKTVSWQPRWAGPPVWNGNALLQDYAGADGVKIGFTEESEQTIIASASRDGRSLIAALILSEDRYQDASRTLDWAFEQPSPCP
jgi:D-alanyl-D-alanine carboxypeptidase